jgi:hypothetical protein
VTQRRAAVRASQHALVTSVMEHTVGALFDLASSFSSESSSCQGSSRDSSRHGSFLAQLQLPKLAAPQQQQQARQGQQQGRQQPGQGQLRSLPSEPPAPAAAGAQQAAHAEPELAQQLPRQHSPQPQQQPQQQQPQRPAREAEPAPRPFSPEPEYLSQLAQQAAAAAAAAAADAAARRGPPDAAAEATAAAPALGEEPTDLVLLQSVVADIELLADLQRQAEAAGLQEDPAVLRLQAKVADCLEQLRWAAGGGGGRGGLGRVGQGGVGPPLGHADQASPSPLRAAQGDRNRARVRGAAEARSRGADCAVPIYSRLLRVLCKM